MIIIIIMMMMMMIIIIIIQLFIIFQSVSFSIWSKSNSKNKGRAAQPWPCFRGKLLCDSFSLTPTPNLAFLRVLFERFRLKIFPSFSSNSQISKGCWVDQSDPRPESINQFGFEYLRCPRSKWGIVRTLVRWSFYRLRIYFSWNFSGNDQVSNEIWITNIIVTTGPANNSQMTC